VGKPKGEATAELALAGNAVKLLFDLRIRSVSIRRRRLTPNHSDVWAVECNAFGVKKTIIPRILTKKILHSVAWQGGHCRRAVISSCRNKYVSYVSRAVVCTLQFAQASRILTCAVSYSY